MADILLIQPPVEDFYFTFKRSIPYGLASIAASLKQKGFSVEILDCLAKSKSKKIPLPGEMHYLLPWYGKDDVSIFSLFHHYRHYGYSFEHAGKEARQSAPFLVGISSLFTPYSGSAEKTARSVRAFLPECTIVMGGHHPTTLPQAAINCRDVDFLLRGEGEVSMPVLAKTLKYGGAMEDVPGIVFRKKNGELHISEPAWIENFDKLPLPAMDLVNQSYYQRKKRGSTVVVAGRGCPMQCTYCSVGASSTHAGFRQRRVKSIIEELESQIEKYNIGFIDFEDENLTLNRKWFLEILREITERFRGRNIELRAMNGLFPPSLDDNMITAMKGAGFKTLNLSLGSSSAEQLRRFRRPDVRPAFEKVLTMADKHGMETVSYIIAGAPGQKLEDSLNDLVYLAGKNTLVGLSVFYPAPGSVDYNICREKNLLPEHFSLMRSSALPICDTTSRFSLVTLLRLTRILNFMKSIQVENKGKNEKVPQPEAFGEDPEEFPRAESFPGEEYFMQKGYGTDQEGSIWKDRKKTGTKLLQWFLHDGIIRGVDSRGRVFEHYIDVDLSRQFIRHIGIPS